LNPENSKPEFVNYVAEVKQIADEIVKYEGNAFSLATTKDHNQVVKFRAKKK